MTSGIPFRYWLLSVLLVSLSACSSSDPEAADPQVMAEVPAQGPLVPVEPADEGPLSDPDAAPNPPEAPAEQEAVVPDDGQPEQESPAEEESVVPDAGQSGQETPAEEEMVVPDAGQPGQENPVEEEAVVPDEEEAVVPDEGQAPAEESEPVDPIDEGEQETEGEGEGEPAAPIAPAAPGENEEPPVLDTGDLVIPQTEPGSNLDRLIQGLHRQLSTIVLDLNRAVSQGEALSDLEEECLGAFDPAFGEQLVGIDCSRAVAFNGVGIFTEQAGFYDTPECQAALAEQKTDACVLFSIDALIRTEWREIPGQNPVPLAPGGLIDYNVSENSLSIDSLSVAPFGPFSCELKLDSAELSSAALGFDCEDTVKNMADQIEKLQGL